MADKRVFFALQPDDRVRQTIAAVTSALPLCGAKIIAEANLHLTLGFLGAVPESRLHNIISAAAGIPFTEFSLHIDRIGWWQKPAVLWLGCCHPPEPLITLAANIRKLAQGQEIPAINQRFELHITIAKKVAEPVANFSFAPIHWHCDSFCLLESVSEKDGMKYRLLHQWPESQT
ncbi:MAG: RNA 2',3'-cyclic phosphodiesterase [Porticoccaceae bacterium]|nr:RNA 2',3'-cyclic phosphodiesterase [Porticoccaceae bacterium]